MKNYKVLFCLKLLKNMLNIFVDTFLVLYFLEVSDSNILPLGIYKLVSMSFVFIVIFCLRNLAKSKYRINLLRIGICLDFVYFLTILLLKEKIVDYIYLVGALYGIEEAFYYSVYNAFESDGVKDEKRANFLGIYMSVKSIIAIIFPILIGSYILTSGFLSAVIVVLIIVVLRIILSFYFKDKNKPTTTRTDLKGYADIISKNDAIQQSYIVSICNGILYSGSAFSSIVTIYVIKIFSDSFSLGVFTSVFSVVTCLLGILFAKVIKPKNYNRNIIITTTFTIISFLAMILKCNMITVIVFNFFQTISRNMCELVMENYQYKLSNMAKIQTEYKVEYFVINECSLFMGRVVSDVLFILMAFVQNYTAVVMIFSVFIFLYSFNIIKLNKVMGFKNNKPKDIYVSEPKVSIEQIQA